MTFWTTLWFLETAIMSMGYEGQTLDQCNQLGKVIIEDIRTTEVVPEIIEIFGEDYDPKKFTYTCETKQLVK